MIGTVFGNDCADLWCNADSGTIYESNNDTAMSAFGNYYIYVISKKQQGRFAPYLKEIIILTKLTCRKCGVRLNLYTEKRNFSLILQLGGYAYGNM